MDSTSLVIALLSVGSVLMDSNLKELCSKTYFDTFGANYPKGLTTLQLTRRIESRKQAHHSWDLWLEEQSIGYQSKDIQYELTVGQTHVSSSWQPGKVCDQKFQTKYGQKTVIWHIIQFRIKNNLINGFTISNFTRMFTVPGDTVNDTTYHYEGSDHTIEQVINSSSIWFTGLLCRLSDKSFYVVVEDKNSRNTSNRTQIVSHLSIEKTDEYNNRTDITVTKLYFRLEPMNQTLFEFFGIDCPEEPFVSTRSPQDFLYFVSTRTLYRIFWGLSISAVIFAFIDLLLSIKRLKERPTENTDEESDVDASTVKTAKSERGFGGFKPFKGFSRLADPDKYRDEVTLTVRK